MAQLILLHDTFQTLPKVRPESWWSPWKVQKEWLSNLSDAVRSLGHEITKARVAHITSPSSGLIFCFCSVRGSLSWVIIGSSIENDMRRTIIDNFLGQENVCSLLEEGSSNSMSGDTRGNEERIALLWVIVSIWSRGEDDGGKWEIARKMRKSIPSFYRSSLP